MSKRNIYYKDAPYLMFVKDGEINLMISCPCGFLGTIPSLKVIKGNPNIKFNYQCDSCKRKYEINIIISLTRG